MKRAPSYVCVCRTPLINYHNLDQRVCVYIVWLSGVIRIGETLPWAFVPSETHAHESSPHKSPLQFSQCQLVNLKKKKAKKPPTYSAHHSHLGKCQTVFYKAISLFSLSFSRVKLPRMVSLATFNPINSPPHHKWNNRHELIWCSHLPWMQQC